MRARAELKLLPNLISLSRMALAVAFVMADPTQRVGLVGIAAATDFFDGWVARRANATSRWGALIDPIADRVFVLVAVGALVFEGTLSTVGYFVLISRDLMTAIGFLVARIIPWLRPVEFKARMPGKIVTTLQLLTLLTLVVAPRSAWPLVVLVGIASAWAIVDYTLALWRARAR